MSKTCNDLDEDICGTGGTCVDLQGDIVVCICTGDYVASEDFLFKDFTVEFNDGTSNFELPTPCNVNLKLQTALYALSLSFTVAATFAYICSVKKASQAKRLIPYFTSLFFFASVPIIKLADPDRFIGKDVLITIFFAFCPLTYTLALHIYLHKYIHYQKAYSMLKSEKAIERVKKISKILVANSIIAVFSTGAFITASLLDNKASKHVFQAGFGIAALNAACVLFCHFSLLLTLARDVERVMDGRPAKRSILGNINGVLWIAALPYTIVAIFLLTGAVSDAG